MTLIKINPYEEKFLNILNGESSLEKFENWLYKNEMMLKSQMPNEIYNELLLLNYKSKESKYDLAKTLDIDYERLELYEIQQLLKNELEKEPILKSVNYEIDVYELAFISFDFEIGNLKFRMHNPFKMDKFPKLTDTERENRFLENFGSCKQFLISLIDSIGTDNFRVYNYKKHEQYDNMTATKIMQTKENEYKILINRHYGYINKDYIKQKMKNAWL